MLKIGRGLDLGKKVIGADDRCEFGTQELERDAAIVLQIVGEVDGGHAAGVEMNQKNRRGCSRDRIRCIA